MVSDGELNGNLLGYIVKSCTDNSGTVALMREEKSILCRTSGELLCYQRAICEYLIGTALRTPNGADDVKQRGRHTHEDPDTFKHHDSMSETPL